MFLSSLLYSTKDEKSADRKNLSKHEIYQVYLLAHVHVKRSSCTKCNEVNNFRCLLA